MTLHRIYILCIIFEDGKGLCSMTTFTQSAAQKKSDLVDQKEPLQ